MNWKGMLSGVAPAIAGALGGPAAGLATRALAGALLGKPDASEESIAAAVAGATPDDLLKLKQADQQFQRDLEAFEVEREKIAAGDRASARDREVKVKDRTPTILAYGLVGAFVVLMFMLLRWGVPPENRDVFTILLGMLGGAVTSVFAYYFGSSAGSARKDETIRNMK